MPWHPLQAPLCGRDAAAAGERATGKVPDSATTYECSLGTCSKLPTAHSSRNSWSPTTGWISYTFP